MCLKGTGFFGQDLKRSKTFLCGDKEPRKDFIVALSACMLFMFRLLMSCQVFGSPVLAILSSRLSFSICKVAT